MYEAVCFLETPQLVQTSVSAFCFLAIPQRDAPEGHGAEGRNILRVPIRVTNSANKVGNWILFFFREIYGNITLVGVWCCAIVYRISNSIRLCLRSSSFIHQLTSIKQNPFGSCIRVCDWAHHILASGSLHLQNRTVRKKQQESAQLRVCWWTHPAA